MSRNSQHSLVHERRRSGALAPAPTLSRAWLGAILTLVVAFGHACSAAGPAPGDAAVITGPDAPDAIIADALGDAAVDALVDADPLDASEPADGGADGAAPDTGVPHDAPAPGETTGLSDVAVVEDVAVDAADASETTDTPDAAVIVPDAHDTATPDTDASLPDVDADAEADGGQDGDSTATDGGPTDVIVDAGPDAVADTGAGDADAGPPDVTPGPDLGPPVPTARIRVMAANLTSGNYQSYDPGHGIRIFQGLEPDIVLIQEFNYGTNTTKALRGMVDLAFGSEFEYFREDLSGAGTIPNGVVSRYPILEAGVWDDPEATNREFAWARIDVPGPVDLYAVSVHLLTKSELVRDDEAESLAAYVKTLVPEEAYVVVGGDMNTALFEEPALTTLRDALTWTQIPADALGNPYTNKNRTKPYDWLIADEDLEPLHAPVVIEANTFPSGLVFDSRDYTPLADVAPIKIGDSEAPSMQHMAVIKDYLLPLE